MPFVKLHHRPRHRTEDKGDKNPLRTEYVATGQIKRIRPQTDDGGEYSEVYLEPGSYSQDVLLVPVKAQKVAAAVEKAERDAHHLDDDDDGAGTETAATDPPTNDPPAAS